MVCHRGRLLSGAAGRALAVFDAPGQAIRCAAALLDSAAAHGIQLRAGIHTGEVELAGDGIAGPSVSIADGVAALARPAEILVSRTVRDLVAGSGMASPAGAVTSSGSGSKEWPLFAVAPLDPRCPPDPS